MVDFPLTHNPGMPLMVEKKRNCHDNSQYSDIKKGKKQKIEKYIITEE